MVRPHGIRGYRDAIGNARQYVPARSEDGHEIGGDTRHIGMSNAEE
jgi:hypothetical protein